MSNSNKSNGAILFVVFKRRLEALEVFKQIRSARPPRLYVASDAPRAGIPGEAEEVERLRREILDGIDWPCEVQIRFRSENLGCHPSMEDAIGWFFEHEEQGIILEDDCVPHASFFPFCAAMLERYKDDSRVVGICGVNFLPKETVEHSYFFSRFMNIWGWATWRRAWRSYDSQLKDWPKYKASGDMESFCSPAGIRTYRKSFDRIHSGSKIAWDAQWAFACFNARGLTIVPRHNLVSNIGLDSGTNTQSYDPFLGLDVAALTFPLSHPPNVVVDEEADRYLSKHISPRTYTRTVRLMFRRWGIHAIPKLVNAGVSMLRRIGGRF